MTVSCSRFHVLFLLLSTLTRTNSFAPQALCSPLSTGHHFCESPVALLAKKKKNKNKKKSGFEWASSFSLKPFEAKDKRELVASAVASFEGRTGKPLCEEITTGDIPKALWNAPIACVIVKDNVIKYANVAALETVGLQPHEYDRLCHGEEKRDDIVEIDLPTTINGKKKYNSGYSKKILRNDNDITILDAHQWAIEKSALIGGKFVTETLGVAYAWSEWQLGNDIICSPGGKQRENLNSEDLKKAVDDQAAAVRELKEGQGLGNKDPQVVEAVQELLRLKALVE